MRKSIGLVGLAAGLAALSACANTKASGFGARSGPNEYAVTRTPPLTMPPDFALRPPKPGAPRPQEVSPANQALSAMFGGTTRTTPGQDALVGQAGTAVEPGVRSNAGATENDVVDKGNATQGILSAPAGEGQGATVSTPQ